MRSLLFAAFTLVATRGFCPEPYEAVKTKCYYLELEEPRQWDAARTRCQELDGDLAVIHTCDDLGDLVRHIHMSQEEAPFNFSFFVGGTDRGDEGSWYWVDGTPMKMGVPYWGQTDGVHEPSGGKDQNCAELNKNNRYYLHDGECEKYAFALCQYGVVSKL